MKEVNVQRRKQLATELLLELKDIYVQLGALTDEITGSTDEFMERVFLENQQEIMEKVNEYNGNIREVEETTIKMTERMNDWFLFTKDEKNLVHFLFPLQFCTEKNKVRKFLKKSVEKISENIIRNRFVKENLEHMEEKLMNKAVQKIEQEEKYKCYVELTGRKKEIQDELTYLLPTIPDECPQEISEEQIDSIVVKLSV